MYNLFKSLSFTTTTIVKCTQSCRRNISYNIFSKNIINSCSTIDCGGYRRPAHGQHHRQNCLLVVKRYKYLENKGVKGIGTSKKQQLMQSSQNDDENENQHLLENEDLLDNNEYDAVASTAMNIAKNGLHVQNVLVIQPYVKWGPKKSNTNVELQLQESEALIRSIPQWTIVDSIKVPLETLDKKTLFGSGKLDEIKLFIRKMSSAGTKITCVFVSKSELTSIQKNVLEREFHIPILDRYSVVIQILRLHAKSPEAKIQVAMAELPYIWSQIRDNEGISMGKMRFTLSDNQKQMLRDREKKLKLALSKIRQRRVLLRSKRKTKNFPTIAVVGYTNAGKTSLIKALTDEQQLQPRNQLFATLDVTTHAGRLPCQLECLFIDTVGFMSNIPTNLIESFIATLEDAMLADLIIHVQDVSHENRVEQCKHVEKTLRSLLLASITSMPTSAEHITKHATQLLDNIVNVGNKSDLITSTEINALRESTIDNNVNDIQFISSTKFTGISDLLEIIEEKILQLTNRKKIIIKAEMGSAEVAWLYKNTAVTDAVADPKDNQNLMLHVIISDIALEQFKHRFIRKSTNKM